MEWKNKLAQLGFTVLQDDKPQLYLRQADVENFIEQNFEIQQQVSVEPVVKVNFAGVIELIDTMIIDMQGWDLQMTDYDKAFDKGYKDALVKLKTSISKISA